jgi:hypothetical protein
VKWLTSYKLILNNRLMSFSLCTFNGQHLENLDEHCMMNFMIFAAKTDATEERMHRELPGLFPQKTDDGAKPGTKGTMASDKARTLER